jgi:glyoxalase family protein
MTTPRITDGFHHITLVASDAGRTLAFWRDLLGLELVGQRTGPADPSRAQLHLGRDGGRPGTLVSFLDWGDAPRGHYGIGGIHHLALGVGTPEAQLRWKRRLQDAGVPVTGPYDRGYFRSIYFADPDGQVVEIATRGPGYAIDEPADALGQADTIPPSAQLRGGRDEAAIRALLHPEPVPVITPEMRLDGLHHITGMTDDIRRADEFYHQALGLRLVKRSVNQDAPDMPHWFWARYDGRTVHPHSGWTLFEWPAMARRARAGVGQTHHVAFRVEDVEDLRAWQDHLRAMGLQPTGIEDRGAFHALRFPAPDGMLLELATDGPGFAMERRPEERVEAGAVPDA